MRTFLASTLKGKSDSSLGRNPPINRFESEIYRIKQNQDNVKNRIKH